MAITIRLIGSGFVNLTGTTATTVAYALASSVFGAAAPEDYEDITVQETFTVYLTGGQATVVDTYRDISKLLQQAHDRARRGDPIRKVYIEMRLDTDAVAWISEIIGGEIRLEDDWIGAAWTIGQVEATITWERRPFWEGPWTELPLSAQQSGIPLTGGVDVYLADHTGTGGNVWFNIFPDAVDGDLPAPVELSIALPDFPGISPAVTGIWIVRTERPLSGFSGQYWIFEAEDADGYTTDGTRTNQANAAAYSDGEQEAFTGLSGSFDEVIAYWNLTGSYISRVNRGYVYCLMLGDFPADTRWRVRLTDGTNVFTQTPWKRLDSSGSIFELGALRIPDQRYIAGIISGYRLELYAQNLDGATWDVDVDALFAFPIDDYRFLAKTVYDLAETYTLVDDGIEDELYLSTASVTGIQGWRGEGKLYLKPGVTNRMYMARRQSDAFVDTYVTVRAYYRPRRTAL